MNMKNFKSPILLLEELAKEEQTKHKVKRRKETTSKQKKKSEAKMIIEIKDLFLKKDEIDKHLSTVRKRLDSINKIQIILFEDSNK